MWSVRELGPRASQDEGEMVCVKSGQAGSLIAEGRKGESTFPAVPSSSRSNEHDAAMITALLRDVV